MSEKYYILSQFDILALGAGCYTGELKEVPDMQWHPITPNNPIPKPENERQVLVLGSKTGNEAEATTTIGASKKLPLDRH